MTSAWDLALRLDHSPLHESPHQSYSLVASYRPFLSRLWFFALIYPLVFYPFCLSFAPLSRNSPSRPQGGSCRVVVKEVFGEGIQKSDIQ